MIIFLIWETQKEENYFEQNETFYFTLNQNKKNVKGEDFFSSSKSMFHKKGAEVKGENDEDV